MPSEILVFASSLCLLAEYAFVEMHKVTKCQSCLVGFLLQAASAVAEGEDMPAYFAHSDGAPVDTAHTEVVSQQPATAKKFVPKSTASIDFDPLHILKTQKRYLPKVKPFHTRKFYENLFFGVYTGFDKIVPRGGVGNDNGLPFGVFVGAHLSPLHIFVCRA